MHHLLLLVVLLGWILFLYLSWQVALPLYVIAVIISFGFYWKILKAQRKRPVMGKRAMIGERARVVNLKGNEIEVDYEGEIWRAVSLHSVQPGQQVIIEAVEGLTLRVVPVAPQA